MLYFLFGSLPSFASFDLMISFALITKHHPTYIENFINQDLFYNSAIVKAAIFDHL